MDIRLTFNVMLCNKNEDIKLYEILLIIEKGITVIKGSTIKYCSCSNICKRKIIEREAASISLKPIYMTAHCSDLVHGLQ